MPRHFRFNELWLLSEKDRRARRIPLAQNTTVLVGANHTGKSTALRMLYYAFGCQVRTLGKDWDPQAVVAVDFSIDEQNYLVLRRSSSFSLFDGSGRLIWATADQGELRERFSELIPFVLPLPGQQGSTKQARPAFFFLPLFVDQDGSWLHDWRTFDGLGEFTKWQKPTIELMLGIRGSEYWQAWTELAKANAELADFKRDKTVLEKTRRRLLEKFPQAAWFRDALTFRRELAELEVRATSLATSQQQLENERLESMSGRDIVDVQIGLIESALREHSADMRFLDDHRVDRELICPTCGTSHENSFHSRLNLESEADSLRQLRASFIAKRERLQKTLDGQSQELSELTADSERIDRLLESHRGELKLRQIVERAGASTARNTIEKEVGSVETDLSRCAAEVQVLEARLKAADDRTRAREIIRRFKAFYDHFAGSLEVPKGLAGPATVQSKPNGGGSGGPRAILAYYFALAHTAEEYSTGCVPPLVIDSPHQQAQDEIRRPRVTDFILRNRPPEQQLIVGLEDPPPDSVMLGPGDRRVDLVTQYQLLAADDYDDVFAFVEPKWRATQVALQLSRMPGV